MLDQGTFNMAHDMKDSSEIVQGFNISGHSPSSTRYRKNVDMNEGILDNRESVSPTSHLLLPHRMDVAEISHFSSDSSQSQTLKGKDMEDISKIVRTLLREMLLPELASIRRSLGLSCSSQKSGSRDLAPSSPTSPTTRAFERRAMARSLSNHDDKSNFVSAIEVDPDQESSALETRRLLRLSSSTSLKESLEKATTQQHRDRLSELIDETEEMDKGMQHGHSSTETLNLPVTKMADRYEEQQRDLSSGSLIIHGSTVNVERSLQEHDQCGNQALLANASRLGLPIDEHYPSRSNEIPGEDKTQDNTKSGDISSVLEMLTSIWDMIKQVKEDSEKNDKILVCSMQDLHEEIKSSFICMQREIQEIPQKIDQRVAKSLHRSAGLVHYGPRTDFGASTDSLTKSESFLRRLKIGKSKDFERLEGLSHQILNNLDALQSGLSPKLSAGSQQHEAQDLENSKPTMRQSAAPQQDIVRDITSAGSRKTKSSSRPKGSREMRKIAKAKETESDQP